ncbi:MAG: M56 family metallopeptidase, partial [Sedimentisphaerales bacterium]|nr:M56 family metallopeptidase [Sedimentisphaerales bacterium]
MDIFWASLSGIFEWVLRTSMYGAVIVLVIVAVQAIGRKKLPPRWSYTLWGVLLLRLVLPVGLQSGFSVWNLAPRGDEKVVSVSAEDDAGAAAPILNATEDVSPSGEFDSSDLPSTNGALAGEGEYVIPAADISSERTVAFNWKDAWRYAPGIWLAGAVLLAVSIAFSNLRLWLSVRKERLLTDQGLLELFEDCKQQMQVRTVVGLVATDRVKSPSLFGFIRPRVLLPREVIEHTRAEELRYIFLHELAHLKRGDIWVGWVVAALQSLHWFNPLIWWAFARMRTDRELACDALALSQVRSEENRLYGGALVSLLERFSQSQPLPAVAGILENKAQLKRRLTMISQFKRPTRRAGFVAAILLAVLAGALLTDAKDNVASSTNDVAATVRHAVTSIA